MPLLLLLVAAIAAAMAAPAHARSDWEFPEVREKYEAAFAFAGDEPTSATLRNLVGDTPTSSSLLLANFAGVVSGLGPLREPSLRAAMRSRAAELRETPHRWGVEPLLFCAENAPESMTREELLDYLLDQFLDDNVRGNAFGAAEILLAGLDGWPDGILPAIEQRWDRVAVRGPLDQEGLRLAQLLLCHAAGISHCWVEEVDRAVTEENADALGERLAAFSPAQRIRLAQVAACVIVTSPDDADFYLYRDMIRPLARAVLLEHLPDYTDALAIMAAKPGLGPRLADDVFQALLDGDNMHLLTDVRFRAILAPLSGEYLTPARWRMLQALSNNYDSEDEGYQPTTWQRAIHSQRQQVFSMVRKELTAGTRDDQVARAEFLLEAGDRERAMDAQEMIIANLTTDSRSSWWYNDAWSLRAGAASDIEPEPELMEAGLEIAVQSRDFLMASRLAEVMNEWIEDWSPGNNGPLLDLMMENLRDDDIPNNGATVYRLLYPHRDRMRPFLEELRDSEAIDWQVRRAARHLLDGEYYLGEGFPDGKQNDTQENN
ncbi:hypothetical protein GC173_11070 [bacterium]|nr:hypothetical protein [bacterium]